MQVTIIAKLHAPLGLSLSVFGRFVTHVRKPDLGLSLQKLYMKT